MAYALIAGLPPTIGLYTAIVMTTAGAIFASSRQLINGPTNAISIALLGVIGSIPDPAQRVQAAVLTAFMVGVIQLAIALPRLGDLTRYVSHSVIIGFTAGASLLLFFDQLKNLQGKAQVGGANDHFLVRVWLDNVHGGPIHWPTFGLGIGAVVLVLALRRMKRALNWPLFPDFLVAVVVTAVVTAVWRLDTHGVKVVGDIPRTLPLPTLPNFNVAWMSANASGALAIALLGLLEAISMSKVLTAMTRQKLDSNQQVLSEGVANLAGSFFSCMPGAGSLTRSAINHQAGARTQWSGVISAAAVALTIVLLAPYARFIPRSSLAGLLMITAISMVSWRDLRYHIRASRFDAVIVVSTAIAAFAVSVDFCILVGVFLSFMLAVPRAGNMRLTEFVESSDHHVRERLEEDKPSPHILIFGFEGELFFGSDSTLEQHTEAIEARLTPETRVVVLRMKRLRNPDAVGLTAIAGLVNRLRERGIVVLLAGVRQGMRRAFERTGIIERVGADRVFLERPVRETSTQAAIQHARAVLANPSLPAATDPVLSST
jgi:SulP family sulfate permease